VLLIAIEASIIEVLILIVTEEVLDLIVHVEDVQVLLMEDIEDFNMKNELTENYSVDLSKCKSLTLISSESCNLNCSYCVIAKSINKE
jgi:sulfatase maturation enzyme AslB (radical SAM superfamily)